MGRFPAAPTSSPSRSLRTVGSPAGAPLLPKVRGQFAEFLSKGSPDHLGSITPSPPVSVCGTVGNSPHDEAFLDDLGVRPLQNGFPPLGPPLSVDASRDLPRPAAYERPVAMSIRRPGRPYRVPPSRPRFARARLPVQECAPAVHRLRWCGLGLGPTNPELITRAQEPSGFRWQRLSRCLLLLVPAFSLPRAPAVLALDLHR